MVYAPVGRAFTRPYGQDQRHARQGMVVQSSNRPATTIGTFTSRGERAFTPPDPGEMIDWVLVLDDLSKNYPPPGRRQ